MIAFPPVEPVDPPPQTLDSLVQVVKRESPDFQKQVEKSHKLGRYLAEYGIEGADLGEFGPIWGPKAIFEFIDKSTQLDPLATQNKIYELEANMKARLENFCDFASKNADRKPFKNATKKSPQNNANPSFTIETDNGPHFNVVTYKQSCDRVGKHYQLTSEQNPNLYSYKYIAPAEENVELVYNMGGWCVGSTVDHFRSCEEGRKIFDMEFGLRPESGASAPYTKLLGFRYMPEGYGHKPDYEVHFKNIEEVNTRGIEAKDFFSNSMPNWQPKTNQLLEPYKHEALAA